jgi:hypothetical protein
VIIERPADTALTTPDEFMVAMLVVELVHMPPGAVSLNVEVMPTHRAVVPVMVPATGNGLTVTAVVATAVPHPLITV